MLRRLLYMEVTFKFLHAGYGDVFWMKYSREGRKQQTFNQQINQINGSVHVCTWTGKGYVVVKRLHFWHLSVMKFPLSYAGTTDMSKKKTNDREWYIFDFLLIKRCTGRALSDFIIYGKMLIKRLSFIIIPVLVGYPYLF